MQKDESTREFLREVLGSLNAWQLGFIALVCTFGVLAGWLCGIAGMPAPWAAAAGGCSMVAAEIAVLYVVLRSERVREWIRTGRWQR